MANPLNHEAAMDKSTTVKAGDMLPEARRWVADVLHVNLADDDELTLALHHKAEDEREERRATARRRLLDILAKVDERTRDVPDAEIEEAIDEAMKFVRPSAGE